jgi:hypothetical protein
LPLTPPDRIPTRLAIAAAALGHVLLGIVLLLFLPALLAFVGAVVGATRSGWQAVGILELALGVTLFLAVVWPRRHASLLLAGLALNVAGFVTVVALLVMQQVAVPGALGIAMIELLGAGALGFAWRAATRPAPLVAVTGPDPRALSTTTMFGLQQTLQALAAPPSVQLTMFPELISSGERTMADFRAWHERALERQEALSPAQQKVLTGVTERLESMLRDEARMLWTADGVRTSREWGELRAAARRALMTFAWSVDMPMGILRRKREELPGIDMRPPG